MLNYLNFTEVLLVLYWNSFNTYVQILQNTFKNLFKAKTINLIVPVNTFTTRSQSQNATFS